MFLLTAAASSGRYRDTGPITTAHFVMIGVLIVLVVLAIIWGARNKRARAAAEQEEAQRTEALLAHPQAESKVVPAPPADTPPAAAPAPKPAARPRATAKPPVAKAPVAKAPARAAPAPKAKAPAAKPVAGATTPKPAAGPAAKAAAPVVAKPAPRAAKAAPRAAKAAPRAAKAAAPKPAKPAPAPVSAYGLIDVKGLGPKAVPLLEGMGIRTLSDLAGLSAARAAAVDAGLGTLSGRLARDRWIDQAKLLAAGKVAEFEAAYGKL